MAAGPMVRVPPCRECYKSEKPWAQSKKGMEEYIWAPPSGVTNGQPGRKAIGNKVSWGELEARPGPSTGDFKENAPMHEGPCAGLPPLAILPSLLERAVHPIREIRRRGTEMDLAAGLKEKKNGKSGGGSRQIPSSQRASR